MPQTKADDPNQFQRFVEMAREIGAVDDLTAFEAAFKKVAAAKPNKKVSSSRQTPTKLSKSVVR